MAKLFDGWWGAAVEREGECPGLLEFPLGPLELLLLVGTITGCTPVGYIPEVLFGDYLKGIFHKSGLEPLEELVLHDVDRVPLAEPGRCQCEHIEVDRDFAPVLGHDGGSHARGHFREKISDLCTEKSPVDILRFITQNIDNIFHGGMVGDRGEVNFLQHYRSPNFALVIANSPKCLRASASYASAASRGVA